MLTSLVIDYGAVARRITSPSCAAKLTTGHVGLAADDYARRRGFAGAVLVWDGSGCAAPADHRLVFADDEVIQRVAELSALLVADTDGGALQ